MQEQQGFTPEPLEDAFTCSVCLDDLNPALAFPKCLHKICGQCAAQVRGQCPMCRERSEPRHDHTMTTIVQREMNNRRYRCNRCDALVDGADRGTHRCSTEEQRLIERFSEVALGGGVSRDTVAILVRKVMEKNLDGRAAEDALLASILAEADALRAPVVPAAPPAATAVALKQRGGTEAIVYIDFDQFAVGYTTEEIELFLSALLRKIARDGLASNAAKIQMIAFGVPLSFRNERTLHVLNLMQVQTRVVSSKKQEETDRQIERDVGESAARVVVLVSSDQDFNFIARKMTREGKHFVVVHNAAAGSLHENRLSMYSSAAWRHDEIMPGFARTRAAVASSKTPPAQAVAPLPVVPPSLGKIRGFGTITSWKADKNNFLFAFVEMESGERSVFLTANRLRGTAAPSCPGAVEPAARVFVIAGPNPTQQDKLSCIAAFPGSWEVQVGGVLVPISQLAPTQGLENALTKPNLEAKMCSFDPTCNKGLGCTFIHTTSGTAVLPQKQHHLEHGDATITTIRVEGAMIPVSALERTAAFDYFAAHQNASLKWCSHHEKGAPGCTKGPACTFVHRKALQLAAAPLVAPLSPALGSTIRVEGAMIPVSALERTAAFDYFAAHPTADIKWCVHHNRGACAKGRECTFAHRTAQQQRSTTPPQAKITTIRVEGAMIPVSALERTAAFDYFAAHQNASLKWCSHHEKGAPGCTKGPACTFVHRRL
jgi:hypothetical protein